MSARERLLVIAVIGFMAAAFVFSRAVDVRPELAVAEASRPAPSPAAVPSPTATPSPVAESGPSYPCGRRRVGRWQAHACVYRGETGTTVRYDCPAGGVQGSVWGDLAYTDDSSVCTAAVHAGAITTELGGSVTISILPERGAYVGRRSNGIESEPWDRWGGSFEIVGHAHSGIADCPGQAEADAWSITACEYRGDNDTVLAFLCPAGGIPGPLWGDLVYTDDSSVCTAAVHAGALTRREGGTATIVMQPGRTSYPGLARHGITSAKWDSWDGSFAVQGASP
jgi:LCCL domain